MTRRDPPAWERKLHVAVAIHDTIVAGDRLLGRVSPEYDGARRAVVHVIDAAIAAGVPEATIDATIAAGRTDAQNLPENDEGRPDRRPHVPTSRPIRRST